MSAPVTAAACAAVVLSVAVNADVCMCMHAWFKTEQGKGYCCGSASMARAVKAYHQCLAFQSVVKSVLQAVQAAVHHSQPEVAGAC